MKQLINFVCAIYLALGVGMALGAIGSIYSAGMDHIHVISKVFIFLLMVSTLVCAFLSRELSKSFIKVACFAPLGGFLIVFMVGMIKSGFLLDVGVSEGDSALAATMDEFFLPALIVLSNVFLVAVAATPLVVIAGDIQRERSEHGARGSRSGITAPAVLSQRKKLVPMMKDFLSRPGNHAIFLGRERTGKSLAIESILPPESILSGKPLWFQSEVDIDPEMAKVFLAGIEGPVAFDEAQAMCRSGLLLPALELARTSGRSYIVAAQDIAAFSKFELEALLDAKATKIILFEGAPTADVDDIVWREITLYEAMNIRSSHYSGYEFGNGAKADEGSPSTLALPGNNPTISLDKPSA